MGSKKTMKRKQAMFSKFAMLHIKRRRAGRNAGAWCLLISMLCGASVYVTMIHFWASVLPPLSAHTHEAKWLRSEDLTMPPFVRTLARAMPFAKVTSPRAMPFVQVTWIPKECRTAEVRKEVADAILKAMINVKSADISPDNLVVRFGESTDGFPLPKGFSQNPKLQAPQK